MDGPKIVIGMTVRGKDADRFWFSLFHEMGHIILGHLSNSNEDERDIEKEADLFARTTLIPDDAFNAFVSTGKPCKEDIVAFANKVGIDAGIVVGRLQSQHVIDFSDFNSLKTQYELSA